MRMTYPWGDFVADYNAWLARVQEGVKSQTPSNADWPKRNLELAPGRVSATGAAAHGR